jgi:ribosome maturation factor RimP
VDRRARIREIAERICDSAGLELVDLEYRREGSRWMLRLFIDKPGGVNHADCGEVSGQVDAQIEVEDLIPHSFTLEVSSPGLDRALTTEADFVRFTGRRAHLTTHQPVGGQRRFQGRLEGFDDGKVLLRTDDGKQQAFRLDEVARAKLEIEI